MKRETIKRIARTISESVTLCVYQTLVRRKVIALLYHAVTDEDLGHIRHLQSYKSREMFEADLMYLKRNHNLLSYKELVNHLFSGTGIRPNSVLLTFDDGYSECFSIVRPLLLKHNAPCIFFVATDFIDNKSMFYRNKVSLCVEKVESCGDSELRNAFGRLNAAFGQCIQDTGSFIQWVSALSCSESRTIDEICGVLEVDVKRYLTTCEPYLTSRQIRQLASEGFTIGAHSKKHHEFMLLSDTDIEKEIVDSCKRITDLTGEEDVPFAFPFSGDGIDYVFLKNLSSRYRFIKVFFDNNGLKKDEDLIINRIWSDLPSSRGDNKSNIPQLLTAAYRSEWREKRRNISKPVY